MCSFFNWDSVENISQPAGAYICRQFCINKHAHFQLSCDLMRHSLLNCVARCISTRIPVTPSRSHFTSRNVFTKQVITSVPRLSARIKYLCQFSFHSSFASKFIIQNDKLWKRAPRMFWLLNKIDLKEKQAHFICQCYDICQRFFEQKETKTNFEIRIDDWLVLRSYDGNFFSIVGSTLLDNLQYNNAQNTKSKVTVSNESVACLQIHNR